MSRPPITGQHAGGAGQNTSQGWGFCAHCGQKIAFAARHCPECGAPNGQTAKSNPDISPKSYGTAVALCGVFGVLGIHHFYLGNILHGLFDLGLFIAWIVLWAASEQTGNYSLLTLGLILMLIDMAHTFFVFIRLIIGIEKDGHGRLVAVPGSR